MAPHHVYLVPGFFGFANFGEFRYFAHVRALLKQLQPTLDLRIHYVPIRPTAGLDQRAAGLIDFIASTAEADGPIHLVGHSTGGIDARLVTTPGVTLPTQTRLAPLVDRVESVVSLASPHRGAPIARFFDTARGQDLLRFVSAATVHVVRLGSRPLGPMLKLADALVGGRLSDLPESLVDQLFRDVLLNFDAAQREQLTRFLADVSRDQRLLAQLAPAHMARVSTRLRDHDEVRYGSVVVRARPPHPVSTDFRTLHPSYALFRVLHRIAQPNDVDPPFTASADVLATLESAFGDAPPPTANDAIVPTLSQPHGELLMALWGDHLDVVGHFGDASQAPPHVEWLHTDSGFTRDHFEQVWKNVLSFQLR